jgi:hypothetical protein
MKLASQVGGYEGTSGLYEYGHRAPKIESVEERITILVENLLKQIR